MNETPENRRKAGPDIDDTNRTVVGAPQHLVHDALAFYDDAADSPELSEMEAFDRIESALNEHDAEIRPNAAPPVNRSAMVTQPIPLLSDSQAAPPARNHGSDDEEASIEDYMANLLQRVNGGAMSAAPRSSTPPPRPKSSTPARIEPTPEAPKPPAPDQREVKPPPESREGLSSMRELANMTARSAIDTHANRKLAAPLTAKLIVTTAAIGVSCSISFLATSVTSLEFAASLGTMGIAALYCAQFFVVAGRISRSTAAPTGPIKTAP